MKGKAAGAKKGGPPPPGAHKAGNPLFAAKKAGPAGKKAGTAPRDFVMAHIAINQLIGDYSDIYPMKPSLPPNPSLRQQIIFAIKSQDLPSLQLLSQKATFLTEVCQTNCQSPVLIAAAEASNYPALEFLLATGVDTNQTSTAGDTAVHAAVRAEFEAGLVLLNSYGASFWLADVAGNTPFTIAAVKGSEVILMRLVDFGANPWKKDGTGRFEIEYIADEQLRKRVSRKAYWIRKRCFAWVTERSQLSRMSFNLKELVSTYL